MNFLGPVMNAIKPRLDDSGMDRTNYYYTSMIIIICSITITARQYVGSPLQCWVPAQFSSAWEQYAEMYCFTYNTYWVKPDDEVPTSVDERVAQQLIYYQWVPFIMALEAAFFYFPAMFWGQMSSKSGLNIVNIVETAQKAESETTNELNALKAFPDGLSHDYGDCTELFQNEERKKKIGVIVGHIEDSIKLQNVRSEGKSFLMRMLMFGLLDGSYIANVYIVTKFLYVLNLVGQFWMMNKFLGQNDPYWGARILNDILTGTDWELSGNFPRIAMCDFQVRTLGNMQRYSIQCVLSLNMFNEKIFLFLYWWFVVVGIFTLFDLVDLARVTRDQDRKKLEYIGKFVKTEEDLLMLDFCRRHITSDVIVLLKFIGAHATDVMTTEIIEQMWSDHQREHTMPEAERSSSGETTPLVVVKENMFV